jgi:hypothetical protein
VAWVDGSQDLGDSYMRKLIILAAILCVGCQASTFNNPERHGSNLSTSTLVTTESFAHKPQRNKLLKGAEKTKVRALTKLAQSENCVKMLSMKLTAKSSYEEALIETRNRAYRSGSNAIAIVEWKELPNSMIMTSHIFSCT